MIIRTKQTKKKRLSPETQEMNQEKMLKQQLEQMIVRTKQKKEVEEKKKEPEPNFEMLSNPARVMKAQLKVISLEDGESFTSLLINDQFPSSL